MNALTSDRREFLALLARGGALVAASGWMSRLPIVSAEEARVKPDLVRFRPEIEPLVRLLEDTPRERLLEEIGSRIHQGTVSYRELLTALLLAGIRNIQPRPVGFKFHAVLVVNSAHLASQNSPDADRWLPIFWALDRFKASQAADMAEGDWAMEAVRERDIPSLAEAGERFRRGMDEWNPEVVDGAAAALARAGDPRGAFDRFCLYGARDFRDIGHKAIYVANGWRTLENIGWQHAEPVLRSLGYAMLAHEGANPGERDALADRPGRRNLERLREIRNAWQEGGVNPAATTEMLAVLRAGTWEDASAKVVELLNRGCAPQSLWDALFQAAAEQLMRRPGIIALHACTTTNALHYAFRNASTDTTRRFLLLQNAAFLPLFRDDGAAGAGVSIDTFEPLPVVRPEAAVEEIFTGLREDRLQAARKTLAYLQNGGDVRSFLNAAQRLIYLKGTDSHD